MKEENKEGFLPFTTHPPPLPFLRADLHVVASLIHPNTSVIDVGCGEGELLAWLKAHKHIRGRGIELSQKGVNACIAQGLAVIQGDADTDLQFYPTHACDYAVLSQTLQTLGNPSEVLQHLVRIGRHAVVSVPNFAQWRNRLYLFIRGRMPVTRALSYSWYETPNIHFCSINDFIELCEHLNLTIERRFYVTKTGQKHRFKGKNFLANWLGEQGIFVVCRKE